MQHSIRHINDKDFDKVEEITREAFWNLYIPGCDEHYLVNSIKRHRDFIPDLSFVIETNGEIVGSILYTKAKVIDENKVEHEILSFGPVSILPSLHRKGLGQALITHSINEAKKLGYRAIILGGFPYHYHCYGFEGSKKYNISMPDGKFYTGIMALELYEGALKGIHGTVHFSDCLSVDKKDVEAYDKKFPAKEKKVLPCQDAFIKTATEIDLKKYR